MFILFSCLILLGGSANGEEIDLVYKPSTPRASYYVGFFPLGDMDKGWENSADLITKRAITYKTALSFVLKDNQKYDDLLLTIDSANKPQKEGEIFLDTLYIDLNRNNKIDTDEKFIMKPVPSQQAKGPKTFYAEKIPILSGKDGAEKTVYVNLFSLVQSDGGKIIPKRTYFGVSSWGCYEGKVTLNEIDYRVRLDDFCINGSFDDYENGTELGWNCDRISVNTEEMIAKAGSSGWMGLPLLPKMLISNKAYSITVKEGGKKLGIEPLPIEFAKVRAKNDIMSVDLHHPEWGMQHVAKGQTISVPKGIWTVKYFKVSLDSPNVTCSFNGPRGFKADLTSQEVTTLNLETELKVAVSSHYGDGAIDLSLGMVTIQDAKFTSYYQENTKDGSALRGIPFVIKSLDGAMVHENIFSFG